MVRRLIATLLLIALPALPALAGKPEKSGKGKGHAERFSFADRAAWHAYWVDEYKHGKCPPGLAKKHNGCMPPGQAKKRYAIGHPLPHDFVILPVPAALMPRLSPCPPGFRYGIVDGDLVQLAVGTLLVVDAIEGLTD